MILVERPYNISYSLNDIRYVFLLSGLQRPGLKLQVKLFWKPLGGLYEELYTFLLTPSPDGSVYLYIQDFLNSKLSYAVPSFYNGDIVTEASQQACIYTIHYRELTDDVEPEAFITSEEISYTLYAIKGGIEKHLHARNNFFKYFEANKPFLTWQPSGKFIDLNETAFLTFLNPYYTSEDLTQSWRLTYRFTVADGNYREWEMPLNVQSLLFHIRIAIPIPIANLYADDPRQIVKFECGVSEAGQPPVYNYTYNFEYRPAYNYYDLVYHNSLGGIDAIRVKADVTEIVERTLQEGTAGKNLYDYTDALKSHESFFPGISLQKKFKGDIGYLKNKGLQYSYLDILSATGIYMRFPFRWVPVLALQKSQDLGFKKNSLNSFPIEWGLSESNEVYTPNVILAQGDNSMLTAPNIPPVVCANVTGIWAGFNVNPDGLHNRLNYSFMPVADVTHYTLNIINSFNSTIYTEEITTGSEEYYGTLVDYISDAGTYTLQIITHCSPDSQSSGTTTTFTYTPVACPSVSGFTIYMQNGFIYASYTPFDESFVDRVAGFKWKLYVQRGAELDQSSWIEYTYSNGEPMIISPAPQDDNYNTYWVSYQTKCKDGSYSDLNNSNELYQAPLNRHLKVVTRISEDYTTLSLKLENTETGMVSTPTVNLNVNVDFTLTHFGDMKQWNLNTVFEKGTYEKVVWSSSASHIFTATVRSVSPTNDGSVTYEY